MKKKIKGLNIEFKTVDPLGYFDMIKCLQHCALVIKDSGGLQKEAYFFKKNCVTLRDQTEWIELIEARVNTLTEINKVDIINKVNEMLIKPSHFDHNLYGNGTA